MSITRQTVIYTDKAAWLAERFKDVTSTEIAALFGLSARCTAYELACLKAGVIDDTFEPNERVDWGTHLESYIAQRIGKVYGVLVRPKKDYMHMTLIERKTGDLILDANGEIVNIVDVRPHGLGASFDFEIIGITDDEIEDNRLRMAFGQYGPGLLEIKNVDYFIFKDHWQTGAEPEAPAHIETQLQCQLEVSGYGWGCISALVGGNKLEIILRMRYEDVGRAMRDRVAKFWTDLAAGVYPPVTLPEDADVIRQVYGYAEPGRVLAGASVPDGVIDLVREYNAAHIDMKAAEDRKSTAQAKLLQLIGDAERVNTDIGTISAGMIAPAEVPAYTRKGYRTFRITMKKAPKAAAVEAVT